MFLHLSRTEKQLLRRHAVFLDDSLSAASFGMKPEIQLPLIFEQELPAFVNKWKGVVGEGTRVPVMFWSHGGNVTHDNAIREAVDHISVWRDNAIYPIYFLWDTGPFATVLDGASELLKGEPEHQRVQSLKDAFDEDRRDGVMDVLTDLLGVPIDWGEMKEAAENSTLPAGAPDADGSGAKRIRPGGAYVFAEALAQSGCRGYADFHAVGHSAGAIFHRFFLPLLIEKNLRVSTLQLLAPAVRIDTFEDFIPALSGNGIDQKWLFSMDELHEARDLLLGHYKKGSLLWFIRNVLEDPIGSDILGLQENYNRAVAANGPLAAFFDHLVWTPTPAGAQPGAQSSANTHTAFSGDSETLNSVAFNILGAAPRVKF